VSRAHARVERQGNVVVARDLGGKNGTWLGDTLATSTSDVAWRPTQMMRIGRTVVALEEPLCDLLASVESAPDEALPAVDPPNPPTKQAAPPEPQAPVGAAGASYSPLPKRTGFSVADMIVMATALGVLALSIGALIWLLRS
jgi:hypothetical protein